MTRETLAIRAALSRAIEHADRVSRLGQISTVNRLGCILAALCLEADDGELGPLYRASLDLSDAQAREIRARIARIKREGRGISLETVLREAERPPPLVVVGSHDAG